jgi:hypothetical protein
MRDTIQNKFLLSSFAEPFASGGQDHGKQLLLYARRSAVLLFA